MAQTRLNQAHRQALREFVEAETAAEKIAATAEVYEAACALVLRDLEAAYPRRDMRVLKKYSKSQEETHATLNVPGHGVCRFRFRENTRRPLMPEGAAYRPFHIEGDTIDALDAYLSASSKASDMRDAAQRDYNALIAESQTYEQVLEVWPAAIALEDRIRQLNRALTTLDKEAISRIRASNIGAAAVKASKRKAA